MLDTPTAFSWTDDNVAYLRKRYAAGASSGKIAGELGQGCTRNAVIGKIHRLGLVRDVVEAPGRPRLDGAARSKRSAPPRKISTAAVARPKPVVEAPRPKPLPMIAPMPQLPREPAPGVDLLELRSHHCRWTDCTEAPWLFCGAVKPDDQPAFCAEHAKRAYAGRTSIPNGIMKAAARG